MNKRPAIGTVLRVAVQIVGFAFGLALLAWCVDLAMNEENREQLQRLSEASPVRVAALFALSMATIVLNGLIFHRTLVPVRRLRTVDVLAVNAVASFLNYLPFKASVISRFVIHNRRDRVPIAQIGAWLAAVAIGGMIAFGPFFLVSLWRGEIDAAWIAGGVAGVIALAVATIVLARRFTGDDGRRRLERLADALHLPMRARVLRSRFFADAHSGLGMLADPVSVATVVALRLADLAVQTARFLIAAELLDIALSPGQAVLFALVYFFIGVVTPFGMLGTREGGTVGIAVLVGMSETGYEALAAVPLLVTATEAIVSLMLAGIAIAWLRPDRLLRLPAAAGAYDRPA